MNNNDNLLDFFGDVVRVNLSTGDISRENLPLDAVRRFIGGRGLGAWYLYNEVGPDVDPLGPENKLIFMNGPLVGTLLPAGNKINLTFKSPLSRSYSYSLCGGHWGPELRFAGCTGLIIEGKAESPVYLWIDDGAIELRPAAGLWGKTIPETEKRLRDELGGDELLQIACIGPAGEKLNKMACITAGWYREFGRGGCGAVMGSKNLKAITVRGTGAVRFHDAAGVMELSESITAGLKIHPKILDRRNFGTPELLKSINDNGLLCTRNFSETHFEEGHRLEGPRMREDIVVGDASCFACPVGCGKRSYVKTADGTGILLEGPEFETIALLGTNCGISDWESLMEATRICDAYGMDTMNAGGCVSLAMECFEKGIISLEDTGGIELRFGNGKALVAVLRLMAERKGIGDILAEGIKYASERFKAPELGMHSKGQALAAYDPRGCKGMALTYATSPKGAHHMIATTMGPEIAGGTRLSYENKGALQKEHQLSMCAVDSLGICSTVRGGFGMGDQAKAFSLTTGMELDIDGLKLAAERIINLERMYNARLGFSRKDDTLPKRITHEPVPSGPSAGEVLDLERMLDEYYGCMGWEIDDGLPSRVKLVALGIEDIVKEQDCR
ncbi:MAG: aldehyde ferredoxin oxidoreductase family protein [Spirochaetes bacterium]|jgi:aldehyde:ferredoxin oxidoreductase|nr:aldehyde ferredoxin oxidoreductase family protein [Spirochaetota bacterium]